ncbi:MAG: PqqD family protein [Planctomycetota bacterium]
MRLERCRDTYQQVADLPARCVESETIIIEPRASQVFVLNEVGGALWQLLERPCSVDRLAELIAHDFDVESARAERDVDEFVAALSRSQLVRVSPVRDVTHADAIPQTLGETSGRRAYETPRVLFQKVIEAVAATCSFDPPLTKSGGGDGCTGLTFS